MAKRQSKSTERDQQIFFDDFMLDVEEGLLWKGEEKIHLRPKSFALLQRLLSNPGHLITKDQLLSMLWPGTNVADEALTHCVTEIRKALNDTAEEPRIIETAHRRGYRFIGEISQQRTAGAKRESIDPHIQLPGPGGCRLVGRLSELHQLRQYLEEAISGVRQLVFVTGEQGIGKTTLVEAFLNLMEVERHNTQHSPKMPFISRGQCIKSRGAVEAYMPFFEILTTLCTGPNRTRVLAVLRRYAPLWLQQMPSLDSTAQLKPLRHAIYGATRERMLREMAEALEALTEERPIALVLEDLHWCDDSSLNLISYLAQRRRQARLLLIATYRPAEVMPAEDYPLRSLKQELQARQQCQELQLGFLDEISVGECLMQRFPGHEFPANTATWLQQRTGGNPLFMVNLLDHLVACGFIVQRDKRWDLDAKLEDLELTIPQTIQQIIERQIEMCTPQERRLLQAASVEGPEFSIAGIAAALGDKADRIEMRCRKLAQRNQFLQFAGIRGTPAGRHRYYRFIHALYQSTCYQLLPEERQAQFHRRVAEFMEKTNSSKLGEVATRLAMHFDRGREYRRAVGYYLQAANNANFAKAGHGGLKLAEQGINLLEMIPNVPERKERELCLQIELGRALEATLWNGAPEVGRAFSRARELFEELSRYQRSRKKTLLFPALSGLCRYHWARAECEVARELAAQMLHLAEAGKDPSMLNQAHLSLGSTLVDLGEFTSALRHFEQSEDLMSKCRAELIRWILGYGDQASKNLQALLDDVLETHKPEEHFSVYVAIAWLRFSRRECEMALESAQSAIDLDLHHRLRSGGAIAPMKVIRGWALGKLGKVDDGYEQARQALTEFQTFGLMNMKPMVLMVLADLSMDAGQMEQGLAAVEEALYLSKRSGIRLCDAELYRLKGELLWQRMTLAENLQLPEVESCFDQAIMIARQQKAKSFELRAATSLAKLWQKQSRKAEARERLEKICGSIAEGYETPDMRRARELLQELS
jgi:DNA-binding winged helix-turn-helix (wHTH) protein/tetratricopeptide (TPR) repeat protein